MNLTDYARLSDVLSDVDTFSGFRQQKRVVQSDQAVLLGAEVEWRAAIAALTEILPMLPRQTASDVGEEQQTLQPPGLVLSGPLPVLSAAQQDHRLEQWIITPQPLAEVLQGQKMLPSSRGASVPLRSREAMQILPLPLESPLLAERFCLVFTPAFSVGLVLGQPTGASFCLQHSFDPQTLLTLWQQIKGQFSDTVKPTLAALDKRITEAIAAPDYRIITQFTQALLSHLPHRTDEVSSTQAERTDFSHKGKATDGHAPSSQGELSQFVDCSGANAASKDAELLQAMAHEIRTPLTTIRTLTRSLLRRKDVSAEVKKRLGRIDQECTQQIDRFNLIFKAVEIETAARDRPRSMLTPIALSQIFQDSIPRWQQQAQRRNLNLDVSLPSNLPRVTSDPTLLNEVLGGVVEWFTQCLPPQSHVHMNVMLAGHQLKLQFEAVPSSLTCPSNGNAQRSRQVTKPVGQLLAVDPETGSVSLNLNVTKNLFEFLGGKLILRQKPEQGDVLTAFLPLDTREI